MLREELVGESIRYTSTKMVPVLVRASDVVRRDSLGLERAARKVWL
jgi:hypothetical protein